MNRLRLIDEVSIYLVDRNNCHITLLYVDFKRCLYFLQEHVDSCRGILQLGGLVPVVRLGVPLRCKACKLGDPLSYPHDNERTLV